MAPSAGSRRRRRASADELVTIYWRDIPAQVTATSQGNKGSWVLGERFQVAIDRAAGVAGLTAADDYVAEWRRDTEPCEGEPQAAAEAKAQELEALYSSERVRTLVDNGGLEPATSTTESAAQ